MQVAAAHGQLPHPCEYHDRLLVKAVHIGHAGDRQTVSVFHYKIVGQSLSFVFFRHK